MAPKRRTSSGPVAKSSQSTLSFNNKNRITKPSSTTPFGKDPKSNKLKTEPALLDSLTSDHDKTSTNDETSPVSADEVETAPTTAEAAVLQQAEQAQQRVVKAAARTPEEERASRVSDAKVKAYWREKERQSMAPRVHQEDLSLEEKVLREWDMSGEYGVSAVSLSRSIKLFP